MGNDKGIGTLEDRYVDRELTDVDLTSNAVLSVPRLSCWRTAMVLERFVPKESLGICGQLPWGGQTKRTILHEEGPCFMTIIST
jgi:hypothetical protein